jgi:hypothetical protein
MGNIKIFEKHFRKGMINKDFGALKKTHPTLMRCILEAMDEVLPQADVIKSVCFYPWHDKEVLTVGGCTKCKEYKEY